MNRPIGAIVSKVASDKLTENTLSDEIYDNLRVLSFMYPFPDEMKALFEKGMFIKSNPKAFPHIIRYLLMIYDPAEFRKKFTWPLYNKETEARFRNSTVDFLNQINIKYNLRFGTLKNNIVVFPGGYDFMKILHELIKLTMRAAIKKCNQTHNELAPISLNVAQTQLKNNQRTYDCIDAYSKKIEQMRKELKTRTERLMQVVGSLTRKTSVTNDMILNGNVETSCFELQENIVTKYIQCDLESIKQFQQKCSTLDLTIARVFEKRLIVYKDDDLHQFLGYMRAKYPQYGHKFDRIIVNHEINIDPLLFTFQLALPIFDDQIRSCQPQSKETLQYEERELEKLITKSSATFYNLLLVDKNGDVGKKARYNDGNSTPKPSHMKSMIFSTPPISYQALHRSERFVVCPKRISLMDDLGMKRNAATTNASASGVSASKLSAISENLILVTPVRNSSLKSIPATQSPLHNDKLDPLQLLHSMAIKPKARRINRKFLSSSLVQLKWPETKPDESNNELKIINEVPNFSSTLNGSIAELSDNISTNLMESRPQDNSHNQALARNISYNASPIALNSSDNIYDTKLKLTKTPSIRQQYTSLDEDGLNSLNVHRSPSGRIKSRYNLEGGERGDLIVSSLSAGKEEKDLPIASAPQRVKLPSNCISEEVESSNASNAENNQNANNVVRQPEHGSKTNLFNIFDADNESILNISDSVLNKFNLF